MGTFEGSPDKAGVLDILARHPNLPEAARRHSHFPVPGKKREALLPFNVKNSAFNAIDYLGSIHYSELTHKFFNNLCLGSELPPGDPALVLREFLTLKNLGENGPDREYRIRATVKALNAHINNQPVTLTSLLNSKNETFTGVYGCPFGAKIDPGRSVIVL
jgi:hypothetical protein